VASLEDVNVCQDNTSTDHGNQLLGVSQQGSLNNRTIDGRVTGNYPELWDSSAGASGNYFGTNNGHLEIRNGSKFEFNNVTSLATL
jgi:hypothetical protein